MVRLAGRSRGRAEATLVALPQERGEVLLYGGHSNFIPAEQGDDEVHVLSLEENCWRMQRTTGTTPSMRFGHTASVAGRRMFVFGGTDFSDEVGRDVRGVAALCFDGYTWMDIPTQGDGARCRHVGGVVGGDEGSLVVFGGKASSALGDTWLLDLRNSRWRRLPDDGAQPRPRLGHTACAMGSALYVLGGKNGSDSPLFEDMWRVDTEGPRWVELGPGLPREGASAVAVRERLFVFGGSDGTDELGDALTCDVGGSAASWSAVSAAAGELPSPRVTAAAASVGSSVVIHGGWSSADGMCLGDTFFVDVPV